MGCTRYTLAGEHKRRSIDRLLCFEFPSYDFICFCQKLRVTNTGGVETFKIMGEFSCDCVCYLNNTRLLKTVVKTCPLCYSVYSTQGVSTHPERQVAVVTKFCPVDFNACGSSVWNLLHYKFLASRIFSWILDLWNICGSVNNFTIYTYLSGFGGLGVACWPLVPKFAGSNPAEAVGFLGAKKSSARLPSEGK